MSAPVVMQRHTAAYESKLPDTATLEQLLATQEPFVITVHSDEPHREHGEPIAWGGYQRRWFWIADYGNDKSYALQGEAKVFIPQSTATQPWDADKMIGMHVNRYRIGSVEELKEEFSALGYEFPTKEEWDKREKEDLARRFPNSFRS